MSAVTALIFAGHSHSNKGGLRPSILIQLEEGGRPCFSFSKISRGGPAPAFKMIPTIDFMVDDLILMIAYSLVKVPEIVDALEAFISDKATLVKCRLEMDTDLTEQQRLDLYEILKNIRDFPKIGICLLKRSSLESSIHHLNDYSMACEVSKSVFVRDLSVWDGKWKTYGNL